MSTPVDGLIMRPKLRRIRAGLYEHPTGVLIVRTGGWHGPRSTDLARWEYATRGPDGSLNVEGLPTLHRTLRDAAAALGTS